MILYNHSEMGYNKTKQSGIKWKDGNIEGTMEKYK